MSGLLKCPVLLLKLNSCPLFRPEYGLQKLATENIEKKNCSVKYFSVQDAVGVHSDERSLSGD
jgi:hypothetical protein